MLEGAASDGRDVGPERAAALVPGYLLDGRFRVVRSLGRGGNGSVYEVETPDGARRAAKVLESPPGLSRTKAGRRLQLEARAAAAIESTYVVRVYDAGHDANLDAPYIVIELLRGIDLGALYKQRAPIAPAPLVRVFLQACDGLAAAHVQNVVHRDIKPSNLFLVHEREDDRITVKICDFGIAKPGNARSPSWTDQESLTQSRCLLGSPMYMSPEQVINARGVDHRSDLWSLAISLYEGLSGHKPWLSWATAANVMVAICTKPVPRLERVAPWLDPGLCEVIHKALAPDPNARWAKIQDFREALEPHGYGSGGVRMSDLLVPLKKLE